MKQALSIGRLVNVDVILTPAAASFQNINTLLVLGTSEIIDVHERFRLYTGIDGVATDFGTTTPEYKAAALYFEQSPQPDNLIIGRWADVDTPAILVGAPLTAAQRAITNWTGFTTPSFRVSINGTQHDILPASFATDTNLNGIAAKIETALDAVSVGATCVWDSNLGRFTIMTGETGAATTISFLSTAASGQDISGVLKMLSTDSGAYVVDGIDAETAVEAVTLFDANYGRDWYALTVLGAVEADHLAIAEYIEAATNKHIYGISHQQAGVLSAVDTTNISYLMKQLEYKRTVTQYSSTNAYSICSLFGRILTVDYNGNNTVITLMYKQEPGIVAEVLTPTEITALEGHNCNVFVAYNNDTAIIEKGVVASGDFLDIITGTDWLALDIQTSVYNLLYTSPTKIPQTDEGNHLISTTIISVCERGVTNGLLAPGTWESSGFGTLKQGDFLSKGYYVYAPPVRNQSMGDRAARKSVTFQVAAKLAGAIHTVDILVNVNR